MRRIARLMAAFVVTVGMFAMSIPVVNATTIYMAGLLNTNVLWSSVHDNSGPVYSSSTGSQLVYNTFPDQIGFADGVKKLTAWVASSSRAPGDKVLSYSNAVSVATGAIREMLAANASGQYKQAATNLSEIEWLFAGSTETPHAPHTAMGYKNGAGLPTDQGAIFKNVTYLVAQYDVFADAPTDKTNLLAALNASLLVHIFNYSNLDLTKPDAVWVDPVTGSTTKYYTTKVLPILSGIAWLLDAKTMAKLDAWLRPIIEAAYNRPVALPDPWKPDSDTAETSSVATVAATEPQQVKATEAAGQQESTEVDPATVVENKVNTGTTGAKIAKIAVPVEPGDTASDVEESPKTAEAEEEVADKVASDTKDEAEAKVDDRKADNEDKADTKQSEADKSDDDTKPSEAKQTTTASDSSQGGDNKGTGGAKSASSDGSGNE